MSKLGEEISGIHGNIIANSLNNWKSWFENIFEVQNFAVRVSNWIMSCELVQLFEREAR